MLVVLALLGLLALGIALWILGSRVERPKVYPVPPGEVLLLRGPPSLGPTGARQEVIPPERAGLGRPGPKREVEAIDAPASAIDEIIDLNTKEGRRKAVALTRLGALVDRDPKAVTGLIRRWTGGQK